MPSRRRPLSSTPVQHVDGIDETACGAAKLADLASIEVEGGGGQMKTQELDIMEAGLLRALAAFGAIRKQVPPVPFSGVHFSAGSEGQYFADTAALVEHCVSLGEQVAQGRWSLGFTLSADPHRNLSRFQRQWKATSFARPSTPSLLKGSFWAMWARRFRRDSRSDRPPRFVRFRTHA